MARHEILSGKVQLYRRTKKTWHCSASVNGVQHRASTKEEDLELAREAAEDWYLDLRGKSRAGLIRRRKSPSTRSPTSSSWNMRPSPKGSGAPAGSMATSIACART